MFVSQVAGHKSQTTSSCDLRLATDCKADTLCAKPCLTFNRKTLSCNRHARLLAHPDNHRAGGTVVPGVVGDGADGARPGLRRGRAVERVVPPGIREGDSVALQRRHTAEQIRVEARRELGPRWQ